MDIRPDVKYPPDERNELLSFQMKAILKATYYFRYSHVLYKIATLEKSERFDLLPHDFI